VAVVHLEPLNVAFGTTPLSPGQWLLCVGMGSVVLWFAELRKWVLRLRASGTELLMTRPAVGTVLSCIMQP
jgi:hypothetical protein